MDLRLLFLLSLFLVPLAQSLVPSYNVDFDLAAETYTDLYDKLNAALRQTNLPQHFPPVVHGRVVLGVKRPDFFGAPRRWVMVHVRVGPEPQTTPAIPHDDLYILGFKNGAGDWYIVKGFRGLPDNKILPFGQNYGDRLGLSGGHRQLYPVPLGKQSAIEAVKTLASYYDPATTTDEQVKQAFVRFVVMVSEALLRSRVIRETFSERWDLKTFMLREHAKYVVYGARLSQVLVKWKQSDRHEWGREVADEGIGIYRPNDA